MEDLLFTHASMTLLDDQFGLREIQKSAVLEQWLSTDLELSAYEREALMNLRELLDLNINGWYEKELAMHFIGPVFSAFRFTVPYQFNMFSERILAATVNGVNLHGSPDGFIASGYREPKIPFFTFNEYKKEVDSSGDPAGQALAAMLAGQALNQDGQVMYGCYIVGKLWHFMTLEGNHYCISNGHNALTDDLFSIGKILKGLKQILLRLTAPENQPD